MFIGTRYEKLFPASSWRAFRNFKWPGSFQSLWSLHKMKAYMRIEGGGGTLFPRVDCSTTPLLTMFIGTRYETLFPVSSWRAFRNFKWPGPSQSLWSLHKNESILEGWVGGGALYPGVDCPPPHWLCSQRRDRRNCFQHALEGHSETSNDQALLNLFDHYIKMKAYLRVEWGGGGTLPPPPPPLTMFTETR